MLAVVILLGYLHMSSRIRELKESVEKKQPAEQKQESAEPKPHLRVLPGPQMPGFVNQSLFCYNKRDVPPAPPVVAVYLYQIPNDAELLTELSRIRGEMQKKIWAVGEARNEADYTRLSKEITPDVVRLLEKSGTKKALLEFPRIRSGMYITR